MQKKQKISTSGSWEKLRTKGQTEKWTNIEKRKKEDRGPSLPGSNPIKD